MPNHKNPWSEPPDHGIGRSRGGLTTKLHVVCDGRGRPLSMMITAGNINDTTMMSAVLENIRVPRDGKGRPRTRPDRVLADKGYPSRANRAWLRDRRIAATIPERDDQIAHRRKKPGRPIAFGDKQKAGAWLRRPSSALAGERPIALLDTDEGSRQVETLLGRINHGIAA